MGAELPAQSAAEGAGEGQSAEERHSSKAIVDVSRGFGQRLHPEDYWKPQSRPEMHSIASGSEEVLLILEHFAEQPVHGSLAAANGDHVGDARRSSI